MPGLNYKFERHEGEWGGTRGLSLMYTADTHSI
jgi:hypothetical protein